MFAASVNKNDAGPEALESPKFNAPKEILCDVCNEEPVLLRGDVCSKCGEYNDTLEDQCAEACMNSKRNDETILIRANQWIMNPQEGSIWKDSKISTKASNLEGGWKVIKLGPTKTEEKKKHEWKE